MPHHSNKSFMELAQIVSDQLADLRVLPLIRHPVRPNEDEPDMWAMEHFQKNGSTAQEALKMFANG